MAEEKEQTEPLLDLDVFVKRRAAKFEGKSYELYNPGELDIVAQHRIVTRCEILLKTLTKGDGGTPDIGQLTDDEVKKVAIAVDEAAAAIFVDMPADVLARLRYGQKLQVVWAFSGLLKGDAPEPSSSGADPGANRGGPVDWGELIPRLVRFYGGDPMTWLRKTPAVVVRAHVEMMGRLHAGESLHDVGVGSIAVHSEPQDAEGTLDAWRDEGGYRRRPVAAAPEQLGGMGVGLRLVKTPRRRKERR